MNGDRTSSPDGIFDDDFDAERVTLVDDVERLTNPELLASATTRNRALLRVLTGPEKGNVFKLPRGEASIGRSNDATITIVDHGLSRIHARIKPSGNGFVLTDGGSTNGTFIEDVRISAPTRLESGMRFRLGNRTIVSVSLHDALEEAAALSVHEAALRDRLTGLYNRGVFDDRLTSEIAFAKRHRSPLSVLIFDIDFFKRFNDEHGHLTGDAVLIAVGQAVQETVRTEDILARYGGEEFAVIARDTPADKAEILGERIRLAVEKCEVSAGEERLTVTTSVGIATLGKEHPDYGSKALVAEADHALYAAKKAGRNRVFHVNAVPPDDLAEIHS